MTPDPAPGKRIGATHQPALRIGRCVVRPQTREILVDGQVQAVRALVFDLVLALLQARPRALSRDELMQTVWGRTVVGDSALSRTVMEARRALGDAEGSPALIVTVHSFGYRFAGHAEPVVDQQPHGSASADHAGAAVAPPSGMPQAASAAPSPALARALQPARDGPDPAPSVAVEGGPPRLGMLPCRNATGDTGLDWTRLGLVSLVADALAADATLAAVQPVTLAAPPAEADSEGALQPSSAEVMAAMGLSHLVSPTLRRDGPLLWLDVQVQEAAVAAPMMVSACAREPAALARRLARVLVQWVHPAQRAALPFAAEDEFQRLAYARGVELVASAAWPEAQALLNMLCLLAPQQPAAGHARLRLAVRMRDPQALPLGQALLHAAQAADDQPLQARARALLWEVLADAGRPADAPELRGHQEAVQALDIDPDSDWHLAWLARQAAQALKGGHLAEAGTLLDRVDLGCRRSGNRWRQMQADRQRVLLDWQDGDPMTARMRLDAMRHAMPDASSGRAGGAGALEVLAMSAYADASFGLFDSAGVHARQLLDLLGEDGSAHGAAGGAAALAPFFAAVCWLDLGDTDGVAAAVQACRAPGPQPLPAAYQLGRLATQACLRLVQGDVDGARVLLLECMRSGMPSGGIVFVHECARLLLRLDSAIGDPWRLSATLQEVQRLPGSAQCRPMRWALARAEAAQLLLLGQRQAALDALGDLIASSAAGRENACARLDAAWLSCEEGNPQRARRLLDGACRWRDEHPAGLATQARLLLAEGQVEAAGPLLRAAIQRHQGEAPHWHHELLLACERRRPGQPPRTTWRRLPRLVTDSWQRGVKEVRPERPPRPALVPTEPAATPADGNAARRRRRPEGAALAEVRGDGRAR